ncbi:hypothetical protein RKD05_000358 [Microbacterium sp. SLBN-111]
MPGGSELLLGELLDVGEVIVERAHAQTQFGVGAPRFLRARDRLALASLQLAMQAQHCLDRLVARAFGDPDRRNAELSEERAGLGPLEFDLECRATVRRFRGEQLGDLGLGGARDLLEGATASVRACRSRSG